MSDTAYDYKVLISESLLDRMPGVREQFPSVEFVSIPPMDGDATFRDDYLNADAMFRSAMSEDLFDEILDRVDQLRWVQISAAGFDWMGGEVLERRIANGMVISRSESSLNVTIAEYSIGAMLGMARRLPDFHSAQQRCEWANFMGRDFIGSRVMIFGTGAIGGEIAWRSTALGADVLGVNRQGSDAKHFERTIDQHSFRDELPAADYVVLAMPLTPETANMFGADEFAMMKQTACIVNVGRGGLIDEPAIIDALENESIAGAFLDVFVEEPLPAESPIWTTKNLVVTPHTSYRSDNNGTRLHKDFTNNLARFIEGVPLAGTMKQPALGY